MHEVAIARSIVELVEEQARLDGFARVVSVRVALGVLSGVEPRALEFGFDAVAKGTVAEGAALLIDRPEGRAWCTDCGAIVSVGAPGEGCPRCGSSHRIARQGDELRVVELEVE